MGLFILSRLAFEKCLHKMLVQKMIQQKWCSRHNLMECPNFSWKTFLISFNERKQPMKENVIFDHHVIWTFDFDCSISFGQASLTAEHQWLTSPEHSESAHCWDWLINFEAGTLLCNSFRSYWFCISWIVLCLGQAFGSVWKCTLDY